MRVRFLVLFLTVICIFVPTVNADSNDLYLEILSPKEGFSFSDKLTVDFYVENRGEETIVFTQRSQLVLLIQNEVGRSGGVPWGTLWGYNEIDPGENWTLSIDWEPPESWYYDEISIWLEHQIYPESDLSYTPSSTPGEYGATDTIYGVHVPSSKQLVDFEKTETRIRLSTQEINILTKVGPDPRNPENSVSVTPCLVGVPEPYELIYSAEKGTVKPINLEGEYIYIAPDYETTDTITVSFPGTEKYAASSCTAKVNVLKNVFLDGWEVEWQVKVQSVEPHLMVNFSSPKPFTIYKIVLGGIVISEERFTVGGDFSNQIIVNNMDELIRIVGSPRGRLEIWVVDAYRNPKFSRNVGSPEWSEGLSSIRIMVEDDPVLYPVYRVWDFITGVYADLRDWIFG